MINATAKAFRLVTEGPIYVVDYCVDGLHVHEVGDGYVAIAPRRKVTLCDGSCKNQPVIQEQELSEKTVELLRSKLNQDTWVE